MSVRMNSSNLAGQAVEIFDAKTNTLIVERESFSKAASYLGLDRKSLSRQIYSRTRFHSEKLDKEIYLKEKS